jgi:alcohol dehydrogenase class IV
MITLAQPQKILFGRGVFEKLGPEAARLGKKAILVTGRAAMRQSGTLDKAVEMLRQSGLSVMVFDQVEHDPSLGTIERAVELAKVENCDLSIGLGGGSVLDAAKAVAVMLRQPLPLREYFDKKNPSLDPGLPILAVPTTAGTGAEVTMNAVLSDPARKIKKSLRSDHMMPRVAIVDPVLTLRMPRNVTVYTGMDALTQAMECHVSRAAHPVSDALSLRAASLIYRALPAVLADETNLDWREKMMLGSLMAGMAFGNGALGAVHGLSHPLGALLHLPHGLICGALLPEVVAANTESDFVDACGVPTREKMRTLAVALGFDSAAALVGGLRNLRRQTGLPTGFGRYGLTKALLPAIVAGCRSNSMSNNPRALSDADLTALLEKLMGA